MDPESHKTVYGPPEQCPIMDDFPVKYAITTNKWEQYATFGERVKNETYMERSYINKTSRGHTIQQLSSMKEHEYITFYCDDIVIVAKKPTKVLMQIAPWIKNDPCNLCKRQAMMTDFYVVEIH